jgi:hypothetical protein
MAKSNHMKSFKYNENMNIYYIIYAINKRSREKIPIYVGESQRHIGRFGNYLFPSFDQKTNYIVGNTIKYLAEKGYEIVFDYDEIEECERQNKEKQIIKELEKDFFLLNEKAQYNDKTELEMEVLLKIYKTTDENIIPRLQ